MIRSEKDQTAEISTDGVFLIIRGAASEFHIPRTPEIIRLVGEWLK